MCACIMCEHTNVFTHKYAHNIIGYYNFLLLLFQKGQAPFTTKDKTSNCAIFLLHFLLEEIVIHETTSAASPDSQTQAEVIRLLFSSH